METASQAALAARAAERQAAASRQAVVGKRPVSRNASRMSLGSNVATPVVYHAAPAEGVALPRQCFQISVLAESKFAPELELQSFMQFAQQTVVDPAALCSKSEWELDAQGVMPVRFRSFMANANLVPVSFKQQVLQVENRVRQSHEQQRIVLGVLGNGGPFELGAGSVLFVLHVRRNALVQDTVTALQDAAPQDLRKPLKVKFTNEEGVDAGGVAKEFFRLLSLEVFAPEYGLVKCDPDSRYMWFDPGSTNDHADFWMVGAVMGLAVYNNIPGLDVNFPSALFKKLKDMPTSFNDFQQIFPAMATSLQEMLDWTPPAGMSAEDQENMFQDMFCIDFSTGYESDGVFKSANLLNDDGSEPPLVTLERRSEYADLFVDWYLNKSVRTQFEAFKKGFSRVCGSPVFSCLTAAELEAVVCGERDFDFAHLRKGAQVMASGLPFREGYLEGFWEVLCAFDSSQKRQFLKFVTGTDLAPLGGLERLQLKIQRNGGEPTSRLPTSHTCFNTLLLPEYSSREKLHRFLVNAMENAEGFGLE